MKRRIIALIMMCLLLLNGIVPLTVSAAGTVKFKNIKDGAYIDFMDPPRIRWNDVGGAVGYFISIVNADDPNDVILRNYWLDDNNFDLADVLPQKVKKYKIWVAASGEKTDVLDYVFGPAVIYITAYSAPTIETLGVSSVNADSVVLSMEVKKDNGLPISDSGFYFGTSSKIKDMQWYSFLEYGSENASTKGTKTLPITDLEPGTKYYYAAYAENELDTAIGEVRSFTTETFHEEEPEDIDDYVSEVEKPENNENAGSNENIDIPIPIQPISFVNITDGSYINYMNPPRLHWNSVDGAVGYLISIVNADNPNEVILRNYWLDYNSFDLASVLPQEIKKYKIWVGASKEKTNTIDYVISSQIIYLTAYSTPVVKTNGTSSVETNSAILSMEISKDNGLAISDSGFYFGSSSAINSMSRYSFRVNGNENATTKGSKTLLVTDLTPETTYYYAAYAKNELGEVIGDLQSFTTPKASSPTVSVPEESEVETNTNDITENANGIPISFAAKTLDSLGYSYELSVTVTYNNIKYDVYTIRSESGTFLWYIFARQGYIVEESNLIKALVKETLLVKPDQYDIVSYYEKYYKEWKEIYSEVKLYNTLGDIRKGASEYLGGLLVSLAGGGNYGSQMKNALNAGDEIQLVKILQDNFKDFSEEFTLNLISSVEKYYYLARMLVWETLISESDKYHDILTSGRINNGSDYANYVIAYERTFKAMEYLGLDITGEIEPDRFERVMGDIRATLGDVISGAFDGVLDILSNKAIKTSEDAKITAQVLSSLHKVLSIEHDINKTVGYLYDTINSVLISYDAGCAIVGSCDLYENYYTRMERVCDNSVIFTDVFVVDRYYNPEKYAHPNPFMDVNRKDEAFPAIITCYENKWLVGTAEDIFSPNAPVTRGMFVTVLGRFAGIGNNQYTTTKYKDVKNNQWYTSYVAWSDKNGYVNGYGNGYFGVNDNITIEQILTIIARYAENQGYDVFSNTSLSKYSDGSNVSDWSRTAVKWAIAEDIIEVGNRLDITRIATRKDVAQIIYNLSKLIH